VKLYQENDKKPTREAKKKPNDGKNARETEKTDATTKGGNKISPSGRNRAEREKDTWTGHHR
jgi:hypothetical protein